MTQRSTQVAQLIYDATGQLLSGTIADAPRFHMKAYSGGSRGHMTKVTGQAAAQYLHSQAGKLSSHFANTPTVEEDGKYKQRGGTLPAGHYSCHYIAHHHSFGECIQLKRTADARAIHSPFSPHAIPHYRLDDFFIHGSGPKGSDGCIIPASKEERHRLNEAVKNFSGRVVLLVRNVAYQLPAELGGQLA